MIELVIKSFNPSRIEILLPESKSSTYLYLQYFYCKYKGHFMLSHDSTTRKICDPILTETIIGREILIIAPEYRCGNRTKVTIIGSLGISDNLEVCDLKTSKIIPCKGNTITIDGLLNILHNARICNLSALDVYPCSDDTIYFHSKISLSPFINVLGINPFSVLKAGDQRNIPDITLVIQPKGTGALVTNEPDNTIIGGNNRGENAVDLQMVRVSPSQVASGDLSTIGGGASNTASNIHSVVSGGNGNTASGSDSTVGGGTNNLASGDVSTIGGGQDNITSNTFATIGGGVGNKSLGSNSTIGGGQNNITSNTYCTVGGGNENNASGGVSTISGGQMNNASGNFSTVGGGQNNNASGVNSTIPGGFNSNALHDNTYVWNNASSSATNQAIYNLRPAAYTPPALSGTFFINGNLFVNGDVGGTTKSFVIPHPVLENKSLKHICLEAPRPDLIYRGKIQLVDGKADVDIDLSSRMVDTTFSKLTKNIQVYLTNRNNWDLVKVQDYETLPSGKFTIISNNDQSNATIDWLVIAERNMEEIQIEF
jgi:hypothetical protein